MSSDYRNIHPSTWDTERLRELYFIGVLAPPSNKSIKVQKIVASFLKPVKMVFIEIVAKFIETVAI